MNCGIGVSTTMNLPCLLTVPGYGPVLPVFRPAALQLCAAVSTKKNVTFPLPLFQTSSAGSHGIVGWVELKFVDEPRTRVMKPVATSAFLGHTLSFLAAAIFCSEQVGKSFWSICRP